MNLLHYVQYKCSTIGNYVHSVGSVQYTSLYILIFGLYFRKMKVKITVIMIPRKILASIENRHA